MNKKIFEMHARICKVFTSPKRLEIISLLRDGEKTVMKTLAERYLKISCACMYPNERRINQILKLAGDFNVDGSFILPYWICR